MTSRLRYRASCTLMPIWPITAIPFDPHLAPNFDPLVSPLKQAVKNNSGSSKTPTPPGSASHGRGGGNLSDSSVRSSRRGGGGNVSGGSGSGRSAGWLFQISISPSVWPRSGCALCRSVRSTSKCCLLSFEPRRMSGRGGEISPFNGISAGLYGISCHL